MIIELTKAQESQIKQIVDHYAPEIEKILHGKKEEDRAQLRALITSCDTEVNLLYDKFEKAYFKQFKGDAEAILNNAQEQIPLILTKVYNENFKYTNKEDAATWQDIGIGHYKKDRFYIFIDAAIDYVKDELQPHINAFKDDPDNLQKLLDYIRISAEKSPYTDGESRKEKKPLTQYRRRPLSDIKRYGLMNDKVTSHLLKDGKEFFDNQTLDGQMRYLWRVNQAPASMPPVAVSISLTFENTEHLTSKKLTAFDEAVYNAISTRFYYEQMAHPNEPLRITPEEIWRTMNGKNPSDGKATPSEKQTQRICDSIDKMRFTRIYMNITEEILAHHIDLADDRAVKGIIDTYVLESDKCEIHTEKGLVLRGYVFWREPIIYTYNRKKGRIITVPYEILDTSTKLNDTENVQEFKGYLMQQIQLMKNAAEEGKKGKYFKRSNIILLDTIYNDTGILPPEERIDGNYANDSSKNAVIRRMRTQDRGKIEGLLDAWIEKKWIKGYDALNEKKEPVKEKQPVKAYKILL